MYDINQVFIGAVSLIEDERVEHIQLHNRLFAVACKLSDDTVADFIDGGLREIIATDLADIIEEYPLPGPQLDILFDKIDEHLEETQLILEGLLLLSNRKNSHYTYIMKRNEDLVSFIIAATPNYKTVVEVDYETRGSIDDPFREILITPLLDKDKRELESLQRKMRGAFRGLYEYGPEKIMDPVFFEDLGKELTLMVTAMPEKQVYGAFDFIDTSLSRMRRDFSESIIGVPPTKAYSRSAIMDDYIRDTVSKITNLIYPPLGPVESVPDRRKLTR